MFTHRLISRIQPISAIYENKRQKGLLWTLFPFERAVQSLHCTRKKTTPSSVLNKGIKLRPSSKRVGVKKKSPNKSGYILRPSAWNFSAKQLEESTHRFVAAQEKSNAKQRNITSTKPKPLNSMHA